MDKDAKRKKLGDLTSQQSSLGQPGSSLQGLNGLLGLQGVKMQSEILKLILEDKLVYKVEKERRPFLFNSDTAKLERSYRDIIHLIDQYRIRNSTIE